MPRIGININVASAKELLVLTEIGVNKVRLLVCDSLEDGFTEESFFMAEIPGISDRRCL